MSDPNTEFTNMVKNKKDLSIAERFEDPSKLPRRIRSKLDKNKFENMVTNVIDMITKKKKK